MFMYYFDGMTEVEIGATMGIQKRTVSDQLYYAKKYLKRLQKTSVFDPLPGLHLIEGKRRVIGVKILYRFLEGKDKEGRVWAVGMAYTGYRTNSPDKSYFMTIRSNKDWNIQKVIGELTKDDIPNREIFHVTELSWSEVHSIIVNDNNYEWTPDILLDERSDYLESL